MSSLLAELYALSSFVRCTKIFSSIAILFLKRTFNCSTLALEDVDLHGYQRDSQAENMVCLWESYFSIFPNEFSIRFSMASAFFMKSASMIFR